MIRPIDGVAIVLSVLLFASVMLILKGNPGMKETNNQRPVVVIPSPANPTAPAVPSEPPLTVVDFEDMAGLDAATQELLRQRYNPQPPGDFERRLRRLEWAVSALSDRVFGRSILPGESGQVGSIGELGDADTGQADPE